MATKKSTLLSNRGSQTLAATPNNVANERGRVRTVNGSVALATGDLDANDVVMLCGVPTGAVILSIEIANDDLDSGGTPTLAGHVGLYEDADGTTAKDADVYATAVTQFQSAASFTDLAFEARGIELCGQKVWEDAGDSEDPNSEYFIGITWSTGPATAAAGDIAFRITYAID